MDADHDYKNIITEFIKKQIITVGPDITFAKVKKVGGIVIDQNGQVSNLDQEGPLLLQKLIAEFSTLSSHNVKHAIHAIQRENAIPIDILNTSCNKGKLILA